ncbi:MAG: phosphotransferase family protein [Thermoanaerobaculia bacterium]
MSPPPIDATRPVRPGEEIDAAALSLWLEGRLPGAAGPIEVEQFPGGHSNLTYLLRFPDRELVLRRPPFGSKVKTAHDMGREYRVLSRLYAAYPKAPRALLHCDDLSVIGAPFYLMERVRGLILRQRKAPEGVALPPDTMRAASEAVVDGLADLHAVDWRAAGLEGLGHPEGYVARQIEGWTRRWRDARTDDVPDLDRAAAWLHERQPAGNGEGTEAALLHGDYKYDNLVLHPDDPARIVAVLDWEMATVGDPLMDLGTSLGYWMDPDDAPDLRVLPAGPTTLEGNLNRGQVVERYAARSGRDVSGVLFYYVYGLFKIAVIAQQIYFRYRQGLTHDDRFATMIGAVRILGRTAVQAIEKNRIDRLEA